MSGRPPRATPRRRAGQERARAAPGELGDVLDDTLRTTLFHARRETTELAPQIARVPDERPPPRRLRAALLGLLEELVWSLADRPALGSAWTRSHLMAGPGEFLDVAG